MQRPAVGPGVQGQTQHDAAAAVVVVHGTDVGQREQGRRTAGGPMQGQTPAGRVRQQLHRQLTVHAVRRPFRRRVRAHGGPDSVRRRRRQTPGHGSPGQIVGRPVQQTQTAAGVPVRVQFGHVRAGHRRPVRPTQEHGRHSAHLQGLVVRISGTGASLKKLSL